MIKIMKADKFCLMAITVLALTACSNDDSADEALQPLTISASMDGMSVTRSSSDYQNQKLVAGDSNPAVYVCQAGGTTTNYLPGSDYANVALTAADAAGNGSTFTGATFYFPQDKGNLDVYMYAPREATSPSLTAMPITVSAAQYTKAAYLASDFVFGKATGVTYASHTANITLYHAMTKIKLVIRDINNQNVSGLTKVELGPAGELIKTSATVNIKGDVTDNTSINTLNLVTTGSTTTGTVTLFDASATGSPDSNVWTDGTSNTLYGIIPPQNANAVKLKLYFGTTTYEAFLSTASMVLAPATEYTFNVKLSQTSLTITTVEIVDWTRPAGINVEVQ